VTFFIYLFIYCIIIVYLLATNYGEIKVYIYVMWWVGSRLSCRKSAIYSQFVLRLRTASYANGSQNRCPANNIA